MELLECGDVHEAAIRPLRCGEAGSRGVWTKRWTVSSGEPVGDPARGERARRSRVDGLAQAAGVRRPSRSAGAPAAREGRWCGRVRRTAGRSRAAWSPVSSRARYIATWRGQATRGGAAAGEELVERDPEAPRTHARLDLARPMRVRRGASRVEAVEDLVASSAVDRPPGQGAEGDDADQRALERAHVVGTRSAISSSAAASASSTSSCWARLRRIARRVGEVGGADVGDEAGLEALAQAVLERLQVAREAVGGEHDLAAAVVERVERVEELLLGARLALEELDVVDEQDVDVRGSGP